MWIAAKGCSERVRVIANESTEASTHHSSAAGGSSSSSSSSSSSRARAQLLAPEVAAALATSHLNAHSALPLSKQAPWALGALIHEIATGGQERPSVRGAGGSGPGALECNDSRTNAHAQGGWEPSERLLQRPAWLVTLVRNLLDPSPERRPGLAEALALLRSGGASPPVDGRTERARALSEASIASNGTSDPGDSRPASVGGADQGGHSHCSGAPGDDDDDEDFFA